MKLSKWSLETRYPAQRSPSIAPSCLFSPISQPGTLHVCSFRPTPIALSLPSGCCSFLAISGVVELISGSARQPPNHTPRQSLSLRFFHRQTSSTFNHHHLPSAITTTRKHCSTPPSRLFCSVPSSNVFPARFRPASTIDLAPNPRLSPRCRSPFTSTNTIRGDPTSSQSARALHYLGIHILLATIC